MVMNLKRTSCLRLLCAAAFALPIFWLMVPAARAQELYDSPEYDNSTPNDNAGPVRMARFSVVRGEVSWRPDEQEEWSRAATNLPLRQGSQIWAAEGSRAEIQFDDGSDLRLGSGALVTLRTMYSDADGEFTQITLKDGEAGLRLQHDHSVNQVDTPFASVSARGPARLRLAAADQVRIAVLS